MGVSYEQIMSMMINSITTKTEYKALMAALSVLITEDPKPYTPAGKMLHGMVEIVKEYEEKKYPNTVKKKDG